MRRLLVVRLFAASVHAQRLSPDVVPSHYTLGVAATFESNPAAEQLTLIAAQPVAPGKHKLTLAWTGTLSDTNLRGLYISKTMRP